MSKIQKQKLFGLLLLAVLLTVLLSSSFPALKMKPGALIALQNSDSTPVGENQSPAEVNWFFVFLQGAIIILLMLTLVHVLLSLFDKEARQDLFMRLLKFSLSFLLILSLSKITFPETTPGDAPTMLQPGYAEPPEFAVDVAAAPSFEAMPQPWIFTAFIIGAALLIALITFSGIRFLSKQKPVKPPQHQELENNAQIALAEIEAAQIEFNDVILRCYAEMSQTLKAENEIQRAQTMTPHEFEQELLRQGFPTQPVEQLTRLFEQVRYGRQQTGENEKHMATESLRGIIAYCKGAG